MEPKFIDYETCSTGLPRAGLEPMAVRGPGPESTRFEPRFAELRTLLHQLHQGPLNLERVAKISCDLAVRAYRLVVVTATRACEPQPGTEQKRWAAIKSDIARLGAYLDETTADMTEWMLERVFRFQALGKALVPNPAISTMSLLSEDSDSVQAIYRSREAGLLRAETLIHSAFEGTDRDIGRERTSELVICGFEHACGAIDALAERGLELTGPDDLADDVRVMRTLRCAAALRAELTEADLAVLQHTQ